MQSFILRIRNRSEEYSLIKPQQIGGRQNHPRHGPRCPAPVFHERALQDGELADESIQQRQSHRGQKHNHRDRRVNRHHIRDAAVLGDFTRVAAFIKNANDQEERTSRDAVVDLLQHRSAQPKRCQSENTQRAETEVAD